MSAPQGLLFFEGGEYFEASLCSSSKMTRMELIQTSSKGARKRLHYSWFNAILERTFRQTGCKVILYPRLAGNVCCLLEGVVCFDVSRECYALALWRWCWIRLVSLLYRSGKLLDKKLSALFRKSPRLCPRYRKKFHIVVVIVKLHLFSIKYIGRNALTMILIVSVSSKQLPNLASTKTIHAGEIWWRQIDLHENAIWEISVNVNVINTIRYTEARLLSSAIVGRIVVAKPSVQLFFAIIFPSLEPWCTALQGDGLRLVPEQCSRIA